MRIRQMLRESEAWILIILVLVTLLSRLILIDLNKGLWWDEASFLVEAKDFLGEKPCDWEPHRMPGFPLLLLPFVSLFDLNLVALRLWQTFFMIIAVVFTYLLGKELYNKKVGFISALLLSLAWLPLFYSLRILAHVPATAIVVVALYFFVKGFKSEDKSKMFFSGLSLGLCYSVRIESIPIFLSLLLFIAYREKLRVIKKRELYFFLLGFAILFFSYQIWQLVKFGSFFHQETLNYELTRKMHEPFFGYFQMFPHVFTIPTLIFLLIGAAYSFIKIRERENLLLLITFFVFLLLSSFSPHKEDRYLIPILPISFILTSVGINLVASIIRASEIVKVSVSLSITLLLSYFSLNYGFPILLAKAPTYSVVRDTAVYLSSYSNNQTIFIPFSVGAPSPQICLFAGPKEYLPYPKNLTALLSEARKKQAIIYYAFPYDGDVDYISLRNFLKDGSFDTLEYQRWLNETGLKVIKLFKEDETGAVIILYAV